MTIERAGRTAWVGNILFTLTTLQEATNWLIANANRKSSEEGAIPIRLANAYCVALADTNPEYANLMGTGVTFPDGAPIVWALNRRQGSSAQAHRVRGPSLFVKVLDEGRQSDLRHFFVGSTDATLSSLEINIRSRFPLIRTVGFYSPPFAPLDEAFFETTARKIRDAGADVVWVGMGTPKQDFAASELAKRTGVYCVGVGAAFDFVAETVREAPLWVQRSGFEWLYRFGSEPRRLWRRYVFGNLRFLRVALRDAVTGR